MIDYGFEHEPFGVTPDSRMVYPHEQFSDAWAAVEKGIYGGKGFILVTGDIGTGKTTLLRSFLAQDFENLDTAVVLNSGLGPDDLLKAIAEDLGVAIPEDASRKDVIDLLSERFMRSFAQRRQTAVFIDEVQNLSIESLELLRMLSNLETEDEKLVQIVLFGQDEMRRRLAEPELRQLKSRIAVHRHLKSLDEKEVAGYLAHRLATANPSVPVSFSDGAVRVITKTAAGLPRRVNILADGALRHAAEENLQQVMARHAKAAKKEFADLEVPASADQKNEKGFAWLSTAAAWGALILVLLYFYQKSPTGETISADKSDGNEISASAESDRPGTSEKDEEWILRKFFETSQAQVGGSGASVNRPLRWTLIRPDVDLIKAIGSPVLARIQDSRGSPLAIIETSDTSGELLARITTIEGLREMPWSALIIHPESKVTILLPDDVPVRVLARGAQGEDVAHLQRALILEGVYAGDPDGYFDWSLSSAVREFQRRESLPNDAVVGPWTFGALVRTGSWVASRNAIAEEQVFETGPAEPSESSST